MPHQQHTAGAPTNSHAEASRAASSTSSSKQDGCSTHGRLLNAKCSMAQRVAHSQRPKPLYSDLPEQQGSKLVLVVDEDRGTHAMLSGLFSRQSEFRITSAFMADDALGLMEQWDYAPNVVLLGLGSTGLQVCQTFRQAYSRAQLPIIMLIPRDTPNLTTQACIEAGANDWIVQPFTLVELLARLNTHVKAPQLAAAEADMYDNYALLREMLPPPIIQRLKTGSRVIAEQHEQVTILFSDIVNFTTMSHELPTEFIINMLEELFSEFDACCDKHGVYKVETIGDAYMCVAGHEGQCDDHALRMLMMAQSMLQATERVGQHIGRDLQIRVGVHTGPAYSGVVGKKCPRYCFFGDTVNTASRMESSSFPMCVQFSQATKASLDRAWMLRSYRGTGAGAGAEEADDRNSRGEAKPDRVSLGARYQKGKGLVTSHVLKVGGYRAAAMSLGRPDPDDAADSTIPHKDMHSALLKASAAAVAATLQREAHKALIKCSMDGGSSSNSNVQTSSDFTSISDCNMSGISVHDVSISSSSSRGVSNSGINKALFGFF